MLITLKTKLKKITEEELELQDRNLGNLVNQETIWVWRRRGFRVEDILDVVAFDPVTSLVTIYDHATDGFHKLLVRHRFDDVMKLWEESMMKSFTYQKETDEPETTESLEDLDISGEEEEE